MSRLPTPSLPDKNNLAVDMLHVDQASAGSRPASRASRMEVPRSPAAQKSPMAVSPLLDEFGVPYAERFNRKYPGKEIPYTDKDRAAAMAMGGRDIKVSLQVKKKREKKKDEPEVKEFHIRMVMTEQALHAGNAERALHFVNKALEFKPGNRDCFVARAKCYLMLGRNAEALQDAETSLLNNKRFAKGIHIKAETLYNMGEFEHALMYFHRGHKLRPDMEVFRLGIQKAEEAIQNAIGHNAVISNAQAVKSASVHDNKPAQTSLKSNGNSPIHINLQHTFNINGSKSQSSHKHRPEINQHGLTHGAVMIELQPDIIYLSKLIARPDVSRSKSAACKQVCQYADEALSFLQSRQEFWRQQRPHTSNTSRTRTSSKMQ